MKYYLVAAIAALSSSSLALPSSNVQQVRHESRHERSVWIKRDPVPHDVVLPMRIGLTQGNLHMGHDMLMEVSDPTSPKYGRYYTTEGIHNHFAPSEEAVSAVRNWLVESGIGAHRLKQSVNKQWLQFDAPTSEVEQLLKTRFHEYEHVRSGKTSIGCDEYLVKADIQSHIDYITPGVKMLETRSKVHNLRKRSHYRGGPIKTPLPSSLGEIDVEVQTSSLNNCSELITPACIRAMYNITLATCAESGNELGIFEDEDEFVDSDDMNLFFKKLASEIPQGTFPTLYDIDGAKNENKPADSGTEALLDVQTSYPIVYPRKLILFLTDDDYYGGYSEKAGLFNTFLDVIDGSYCNYTAFGEIGNNNTVDDVYPDKHKDGYNGQLQCGTYKPTNVISLSYELAEYNEGTTANYQKRQCNEYMKLGLQGISVVFSSGDYGVESPWGCAGDNSTVFNPQFPSNCPYVTSVGATTLVGEATEDTEVAVTQFPSGGGFSNCFARPSYQDDAVAAYFASANAPNHTYYTGPSFGNGIYNRSGRGIPDVSAVGQNIVNYGDGAPYLVGGTSASAPLFASILTRINDERLKAGKSTVGFVNPTLYQNPQAFHDITNGTNEGCNTNGFSAAPGWDPLTGLGTPRFDELLEVFMSLD